MLVTEMRMKIKDYCMMCILESLGIKSYILEIFDCELPSWYSNGDVKLEPEH